MLDKMIFLLKLVKLNIFEEKWMISYFSPTTKDS